MVGEGGVVVAALHGYLLLVWFVRNMQFVFFFEIQIMEKSDEIFLRACL